MLGRFGFVLSHLSGRTGSVSASLPKIGEGSGGVDGKTGCLLDHHRMAKKEQP